MSDAIRAAIHPFPRFTGTGRFLSICECRAPGPCPESGGDHWAQRRIVADAPALACDYPLACECGFPFASEDHHGRSARLMRNLDTGEEIPATSLPRCALLLPAVS